MLDVMIERFRLPGELFYGPSDAIWTKRDSCLYHGALRGVPGAGLVGGGAVTPPPPPTHGSPSHFSNGLMDG